MSPETQKILERFNTPKWKKDFFSSISGEFKDSVDSVLEIEPCPNCNTDMTSRKCLNCWYWLWEDYIQHLTEKASLLGVRSVSKKLINKTELRTITGEYFFVFQDSCVISQSSASFLIEISWEKIRFSTDFSVLKKEDSNIVYNIKFNSMPEVNKGWKWKKKYIDFKYLKKFAFSILTDSRIVSF